MEKNMKKNKIGELKKRTKIEENGQDGQIGYNERDENEQMDKNDKIGKKK